MTLSTYTTEEREKQLDGQFSIWFRCREKQASEPGAEQSVQKGRWCKWFLTSERKLRNWQKDIVRHLIYHTAPGGFITFGHDGYEWRIKARTRRATPSN